MVTADKALEQLRSGNARYAAGDIGAAAAVNPEERAKLAAGQQPFAAILGCADSRVPVEMVFDRGPGELFVVRVAGNVATPAAIGSIEYAVEQLGVRLVVVLGHGHCGAVQATLGVCRGQGGGGLSPNLGAVVEAIRPAVEPLLPELSGDEPEADTAKAVRANIAWATARMQSESALLTERVATGEVAVIGAEYSLEQGTVDFIEPAAGL